MATDKLLVIISILCFLSCSPREIENRPLTIDPDFNKTASAFFAAQLMDDSIPDLNAWERCTLNKVIQNNLDEGNDLEISVYVDTFLVRTYRTFDLDAPYSFVLNARSNEMYFLMLPGLMKFRFKSNSLYEVLSEYESRLVGSLELHPFNTQLYDALLCNNFFKLERTEDKELLSRRDFRRKYKVLRSIVNESLDLNVRPSWERDVKKLIENSKTQEEQVPLEHLLKTMRLNDRIVDVYELEHLGLLVCQYLANRQTDRMELKIGILPLARRPPINFLSGNDAPRYRLSDCE